MKTELKYAVYLISCKAFIKIGYTHDVDRRIKAMQTGCPYKLKLYCKLPCESRSDAIALEAYLHEEFKKYRHSGEWFLYEGIKKILRTEVNGHVVKFNRGFDWRWDALNA